MQQKALQVGGSTAILSHARPGLECLPRWSNPCSPLERFQSRRTFFWRKIWVIADYDVIAFCSLRSRKICFSFTRLTRVVITRYSTSFFVHFWRFRSLTFRCMLLFVEGLKKLDVHSILDIQPFGAGQKVGIQMLDKSGIWMVNSSSIVEWGTAWMAFEYQTNGCHLVLLCPVFERSV